MIESIIGILTIGFLLGAPAGFSPGPMMVLIMTLIGKQVMVRLYVMQVIVMMIMMVQLMM